MALIALIPGVKDIKPEKMDFISTTPPYWNKGVTTKLLAQAR